MDKRDKLCKILSEIYFVNIPRLDTDLTDLSTVFSIKKNFNIKWESIKKTIFNDVHKIILCQKKKELDTILEKIRNNIEKDKDKHLI